MDSFQQPKKIFFYWRIVGLKCCISFCCTAKWTSYTYTSIHYPSFIKDSYPTWVITEYWEEFPVVYSRSLLIIYFIYTNELVALLHLTLCNPMDLSPPGSSVHGILQARILEWVVIPFSRESNLGLLHYRQILYCLSHQGSPAQW